jgi:hypothetical protein
MHKSVQIFTNITMTRNSCAQMACPARFADQDTVMLPFWEERQQRAMDLEFRLNRRNDGISSPSERGAKYVDMRLFREYGITNLG